MEEEEKSTQQVAPLMCCDFCTAADVARYGGVQRPVVLEVYYRRGRAASTDDQNLVMRACYGCGLQFGLCEMFVGQRVRLTRDHCITVTRVASLQRQQQQRPQPPTPPPGLQQLNMEELMGELFGK